MEFTALNFICIAFVVAVPLSAYLSFKKGIASGAEAALAVLYKEGHITNSGINAIGKPYLAWLVGEDEGDE
jgi:hypothetical protein